MAEITPNKKGNIVGLPYASFGEDVLQDGQTVKVIDIRFSDGDVRTLNTSFYGDGVIPYTDDLSDGLVKWVNGFTVRVNPCRVHINGNVNYWNEAIQLELDPADPVLPRVDSIVVRRDLLQRKSDLYVKKGIATEGATPPELVYNRDGVAEFLLANVYIAPGAGSLAQSGITDWRKFMEMKAGIEGNVPIRPLGSMEFSGFTPAELKAHMPGWYFMNGDFFPNTSKQGIQLNKLPTEFKKRWGIVNNGSATSVPSFFHEDGRGYFVRAADGEARNIGDKTIDTMRKITGEARPAEKLGFFHSYTPNHASGAFGLGELLLVTVQGTTQAYRGYSMIFDSGLLGENYSGNETAPIHINETPVIYLGV